MDDRRTFRAQVLASLNATPGQAEELLRYNENHFVQAPVDILDCALPDEPFIEPWRQYADEVEQAGEITPLSRYLVQLRFPIEAGMSQQPEYIAATRQGADAQLAGVPCGVQFHAPEQCRVVIHPTIAGHIPLLIAGQREDFVALVQALTRRNEPEPIPASMGACMVSGYNNWHRIGVLRSKFEAAGDGVWATEFERIKTRKHLYQDRFIILSSGVYSGVNAAALGLPEADWLNLSLAIRREHECAHYFTRRLFSSMRNSLHDELIADYFGITAALGKFRADWLLMFFGLESFPLYREGGRLQNYRGTPPLSPEAFIILQQLLKRAATNLESFDCAQVREFRKVRTQTAVFRTLACLTVEELASPEAEEILAKTFARLVEKLEGDSRAAARPETVSW